MKVLPQTERLSNDSPREAIACKEAILPTRNYDSKGKREQRKELEASKEFPEAPAMWGRNLKLDIQKRASELIKEVDTQDQTK